MLYHYLNWQFLSVLKKSLMPFSRRLRTKNTITQKRFPINRDIPDLHPGHFFLSPYILLLNPQWRNREIKQKSKKNLSCDIMRKWCLSSIKLWIKYTLKVNLVSNKGVWTAVWIYMYAVHMLIEQVFCFTSNKATSSL